MLRWEYAVQWRQATKCAREHNNANAIYDVVPAIDASTIDAIIPYAICPTISSTEPAYLNKETVTKGRLHAMLFVNRSKFNLVFNYIVFLFWYEVDLALRAFIRSAFALGDH